MDGLAARQLVGRGVGRCRVRWHRGLDAEHWGWGRNFAGEFGALQGM
jgi:hypothetical protein